MSLTRAISTKSVHWKWVIQLLIYQFYSKPWEWHFDVIASGWTMEDLYAYTMCKHTLTYPVASTCGPIWNSASKPVFRVRFEPQLAAKVPCSQDCRWSLFQIAWFGKSCLDQVPGDGTRKLNSIGGRKKSAWLSCFSSSHINWEIATTCSELKNTFSGWSVTSIRYRVGTLSVSTRSLRASGRHLAVCLV
jgi:hypothetical protein